jgi:hypothetical protein
VDRGLIIGPNTAVDGLLRTAKSRYDPHNVFHLNQNIEPGELRPAAGLGEDSIACTIRRPEVDATGRTPGREFGEKVTPLRASADHQRIASTTCRWGIRAPRRSIGQQLSSAYEGHAAESDHPDWAP